MIQITQYQHNAQPIITWLALHDHKIVGHINAQFEPDNRIKFLDAWVHPDWRGNGIYRKLWEYRWSWIEANYEDHLVYAWCKPTSLPLLLEKGFEIKEECHLVEFKIPKNKD